MRTDFHTNLLPVMVLVLTSQLLSCGGGGSDTPDPVGGGQTTGIDSSGGVVSSTDNKASVTVPANALAASTVISVTSTSDPSGGDGISVYEFGPSGIQFSSPVSITLNYDENALPAGVTEDMLQLATFVNGAWNRIADTGVDTVNNTVTGTTSHFSTFGLVGYTFIWPNTPVRLLAPDAEDQDLFGDTVDISGDYAIVGAPREDAINALQSNGQTLPVAYEAGAAYIYERQSDGTWDAGTKLINPEARDSSGEFGYAVAIDGNTAMVSAPGRPRTGPELIYGQNSASGGVYVFERQAYGDWQWTGEVLTCPDVSSGTRLGSSLDMKGNLAIVGTRGNVYSVVNNNVTVLGPAAYIFRKSGDNWSTAIAPARLLSPDGGPGVTDRFAWSVGIDGDYAVVGAWNGTGGSNSNVANSGVAYAFHYDGVNWDSGEKLRVLDAEFSDDLGRSVGISGEWIIAGASWKLVLPGSDRFGAAYLFRKPVNGAWDFGQRILSPVPQADSSFGWSVAIDGDFAVVGAQHFCPGVPVCTGPSDLQGNAYVYQQKSDGTWNFLNDTLTMLNPAGSNGFGEAVAIDNDKVIVGNLKFHDATGMTGGAYVFENKWAAP